MAEKERVARLLKFLHAQEENEVVGVMSQSSHPSSTASRKRKLSKNRARVVRQRARARKQRKRGKQRG